MYIGYCLFTVIFLEVDVSLHVMTVEVEEKSTPVEALTVPMWALTFARTLYESLFVEPSFSMKVYSQVVVPETSPSQSQILENLYVMLSTWF